MSDDLTLELEKVVREAGGSGCGFSDLSDLQDLPYPGLTRGVTVLLALAPAIIAAMGEGPTRDYHDEYERANKELARIGFEVVRFLEKAGYRAGLIDPTTQEYDEGTLSAPFPHKTAALRAGVGWIGKCDLLVTEEFGSAFRMCTIFTDAPLTPGDPSRESRCGPCTDCVLACPVKAPTGKDWMEGVYRDELVDIFACNRYARKLSADNGWSHVICGICIQACPWTRRYINSRSVP
ncbi:MAG: epoxyqueuosine reductase [Synergistaceae bacterium]|nr:epoxyqueuosine reductase [Synergistaceae bacterium]